MTPKQFIEAMLSHGNGASEKSIALFEKELGAKLPADYRGFLRQCNTGDCGGIVQFKRNGPSIALVFGLSSENISSLSWYLNLVRKGEGPPIPEDLLPIMVDPGFTFVCLAWRGKDAGKIFRWQPCTAKKIAASFTDFVKGLREVSEDEDDD